MLNHHLIQNVTLILAAVIIALSKVNLWSFGSHSVFPYLFIYIIIMISLCVFDGVCVCVCVGVGVSVSVNASE